MTVSNELRRYVEAEQRRMGDDDPNRTNAAWLSSVLANIDTLGKPTRADVQVILDEQRVADENATSIAYGNLPEDTTG